MPDDISVTQDMISYERDGSYLITVNSRRYRVEIVPDIDSTPYDADCYSEADVAAWRDDKWSYAGVIVMPLDVPGDVQFELSDSLWGVEVSSGGYTWNRGNEFESVITDDHLLASHPVPGMLTELDSRVSEYYTLVTAFRAASDA